MKKKEKIQLIVLSVVSLSLLVAASMPLNVKAWANGNFAETPEKFSQDYDTMTFKCYGTHDFIAEKVYDLTIFNWQKADGTPFHTDRIFCCFMLGTEVPDYSGSRQSLSIILDTHCGSVSVGYQIAGFVTGHNFLIGKDGKRYGVLEEHNAETNCQIAFERALYHFYRNECEAAAYYLGCMVHFISDVSCFPHVLPSIYANDIQREEHGLKITLKGLHKSYERQVSNLMNHPYWCNPINFDTNKHQWNHQIMDPTLAISGCARDTFFGDQGHGAIWMYEHVAWASRASW